MAFWIVCIVIFSRRFRNSASLQRLWIYRYLSGYACELRQDLYDLMDKYFRLGNNLNQRDTIAVRKVISGFTKLLYPDGEVTKELR